MTSLPTPGLCGRTRILWTCLVFFATGISALTYEVLYRPRIEADPQVASAYRAELLR